LKWQRFGSHRATATLRAVEAGVLRCYWETTVINHRTGVEELSSRTDRTTPFTVDKPNVSFAT
jgi:hypothetical protein